jgi:hypothetical protein
VQVAATLCVKAREALALAAAVELGHRISPQDRYWTKTWTAAPMASLTRTVQVRRRQKPKRLGVSSTAVSEVAQDLAAAPRLDNAPSACAASLRDGPTGESDADIHQSIARE